MKNVSHRALLAVGVAILVGTAAVAVGAAGSRSSEANAAPPILSFRDAPLTPALREGLASAAETAGLRVGALREVAGVGEQPYRASIFVGTAPDGAELIALRMGDGYSTFTPLERILASERPLSVSVAAQPDAGGLTGHVQLVGIATPEAKTVVIDLANGRSQEAELVRLGRGPISFLAYASDDSSTFPVAVRALGASGRELAVRDLRSAVAPPEVANIID